MAKLYYTAPSDEIFNEMKEKAIEVWSTYDNTYGYRDEKVSKIEPLENVRDNFMYIFAMFDFENQEKVVSKLSVETKQALKDRMIDGGNPIYYLENIGL